MRLITDERLIKRNTTLARASNLLGLAVLTGALVINFTRPELVAVSFGGVIVGFIVSNLGIYLANRWLRKPRPDEALDASLKGLDDRYALYHFRLGASHALFGPGGVIALLPKWQGGEIAYQAEKGRWSHKGGSLYLRIFGQDRLGNPSAEAATEADALARKLKKLLPERDLPPIQAVVVFTNDSAQVQADGAPLPSLHAKKLKAFVRNLPKAPTLNGDELRAIEEKLGV